MKKMKWVVAATVISAMVLGAFISSSGAWDSPEGCSTCGARADSNYYTITQITEYLWKTLAVLDESIAIGGDRASYLMKVQVQCALGDLAGAEKTLDEYDRRYQTRRLQHLWRPGGLQLPTGESVLLRAMILACANGRPSEIVWLLQQALGRGVWGMDDKEFWGFIETSGVFACYLGSQQSTEFRHFLAQKGKVKLPVPEGMPPRWPKSDYGRSEWDTSWHSLYLYVGHEFVPLLTNFVKMAEEMAHWVGAITELDYIFVPIAIALATEHIWIEHEDKGCGVELAWYWLQIYTAWFFPFRVDTQGEECKGITNCYPPEHLTVNFDWTKPVRFSDRIQFTASKVNFPAQYMFRFTYPGQSLTPRETDWLTSNEFETDAKWTTKCNDCDVTAYALTRNTRTGRVCGAGPESVTYHIYQPDPNIEKITGFTYSESEEELPCNADFEMKITPIGGRCTSGEGEKWMWVYFVNSSERRHFMNDDGPYSFNPSRICKNLGWVKPGDTLQFRVYAYCKDHQQYSTDAWTKVFTIQEDQWTKKHRNWWPVWP